MHEDLPLLPAFHPVNEPVHEDWDNLQVMFSYTFKNKPCEFHNGGMWPMLTGFYAVDLARRGNAEAAAVIADQALQGRGIFGVHDADI